MLFWWFTLCMVLLIPGAMLIFGLLFRRAAPREINVLFGYRTSRSMKSKETWAFAHRLCGKIWTLCALVSLPFSVTPLFFVIKASEPVIGTVASVILFVQLAVLILPIPIVEAALRRHFDENGKPKGE